MQPRRIKDHRLSKGLASGVAFASASAAQDIRIRDSRVNRRMLFDMILTTIGAQVLTQKLVALCSYILSHFVTGGIRRQKLVVPAQRIFPNERGHPFRNGWPLVLVNFLSLEG